MDVDGLADALGAQASVNEPGVFDASGPHPRFSLYKSSSWTKNSQEKRRQDLLERQKSDRFETIQNARNLPADLEKGDEKEIEGEQDEEPMQISKDKNLHRTPKPIGRYRDQLMLSEWLVDVPESFAKNWLMVPSPEGRRALVVAAGGYTQSFSKAGYKRNGFVSLLPGGNKNSSQYETWLDCIFCEKTGTFYILDCIFWKDQEISCGERNFRYFWLKSQFDNDPHLSEISSKNKYRFILLPQFSCDVKSIEKAINEELPYTLDGLLFYCNDAYYWPGLTPLVGWLKPFMLTEILNVENLPARYKDEQQGTTAAQFIKNFNEAEEKRKGPHSPPIAEPEPEKMGDGS